MGTVQGKLPPETLREPLALPQELTPWAPVTLQWAAMHGHAVHFPGCPGRPGLSTPWAQMLPSVTEVQSEAPLPPSKPAPVPCGKA